MSDYYPIVGRKGTGLHDRLSIEDLQTKEPEQFALFIMAFLKIQGRGDIQLPDGGTHSVETPGALYMNIAGIHGRPFEQWPGDRRKNPGDFNRHDPKDTNPVPSRFGGYCSHGAVIFPTWHRPYVLLIEQAIGEAADEIAVMWEKHNPIDRGKWVSAAKKLRFPFWDWAEKRVETEGLPGVLHLDEIQILVPGGKLKSVPNPLAYMPIPNAPADFVDTPDETTKATAYFKEWKRTYRYAESTPDNPKTNIGELQKYLKSQVEGLRSKVSLLFTSSMKADPAQTWDEFSNHTTQSLRNMDFYNVGSLEGVHDSIHRILGGNGHMSNPDYAAFDPIFFLHHCNVDRLYALWEYCYTDVWMGDGYSTNKGQKYPWYQASGTYVQVYNEQLTPETGLSPFRTDKGEYWTSDQARFLDEKSYPKYYSYPEIVGVKVDKPATSQERIDARLALQKYYGLDPYADIIDLKFSANPLFNLHPKTREGHFPLPGYRHFVVVVQLLEHAYNGSYSFKLYHDDKPDDDIKPVLVGSVDVFARPDTSPCKGCSNRRNAGTIVRGVIRLCVHHVNSIIALHPELDDKEASKEALAKHMKSALTAVLENPHGSRMASAGSQAGELGPGGEMVDMSEHLAPVKVTLLSSTAEFSEDPETRGPARFVGWVNHGDVFEDGHQSWKMSAGLA